MSLQTAKTFNWTYFFVRLWDVESDYDLLLSMSCVISVYRTLQGMHILITLDPHNTYFSLYSNMDTKSGQYTWHLTQTHFYTDDYTDTLHK